MIYIKYFLIVYLHKYIGAKEIIESKAKTKKNLNLMIIIKFKNTKL